MPLYVYNCPDCDLEIEEKRPIAEADDVLECPLCGGFCQRAFSMSFGIWKSGQGDSAPTSSPMGLSRPHSFGCSCCRR